MRAETIRRLHTPRMTNADGSGYASGWIIERDGESEFVHWHSGSAGTFYASLWLYPSRNVAVAIATNSAGNAGIVQRKLAEAILRKSVTDARSP